MGTKYDVKIDAQWHYNGARQIQIKLSDSMISYKEEYLGCDMTCIIGEFGGNLGFFLGGSLLIGLDIILQYFAKALQTAYVVWNNIN